MLKAKDLVSWLCRLSQPHLLGLEDLLVGLKAEGQLLVGFGARRGQGHGWVLPAHPILLHLPHPRERTKLLSSSSEGAHKEP